MASYYWIKLYHEILTDPKMGRLPDNLWRRAIECFLMAGETNNEGHLPELSNMAWTLRMNEQQLEIELIQLADVNIVEVREGHWFVTHFAKRQAAVSGAKKQANYRDRQRKQQYYENDTEEQPTSYEAVTNGNTDTDTDTDIDTIAPKSSAGTEDVLPGDVLAEVITDPPREKTNSKDKIRGELENYFAEISNIPIPARSSAKQKSAAGELWWQPLRQILDMTGWDLQQAKGLIRESYKVLKNPEKKLNVSSPKSILKTAISLHADGRVGTNGKRRIQV